MGLRVSSGNGVKRRREFEMKPCDLVDYIFILHGSWEIVKFTRSEEKQDSYGNMCFVGPMG